MKKKSGSRVSDTILGDFVGNLFRCLVLKIRIGNGKRFCLSGHDSKVETGQFSQVIDYKTRLQELLQVHGDVEVSTKWSSESGLLMQKEFEVEVFVNGKTMGRGHGRSKKLGAGLSHNAVEAEE